MHDKVFIVTFFLFTAFAACSGGGSQASETETPRPGVVDALRIMPLGDSITSSRGGEASYRYWLYRQLSAAGVPVDFVGSERGVYEGQPRYSDFDQDHEGHWSWRADEILVRIEEWARLARPDIVLIHLGTNDMFQGRGTESTARDIGEIIETIRRVSPGVRIVLALVIGSTIHPERLVELNAVLPGTAAALSTPESPILLVDQYAGFDPAVDTSDGIHPNATGEVKIAANFLAAIFQLL